MFGTYSYKSNTNLICTGSLSDISVRAKPTKRGTMVESGEHVNSEGVVKDVPACYDNLTTTLEAFAVEEVPVDLQIGISELERLYINLDLGGQLPKPKISGEDVRAALQWKTCYFGEGRSIADQYFETNSSCNDGDVSSFAFRGPEEKVVSLSKTFKTQCDSQADQTFDFSEHAEVKIKLSNLKISTAEQIGYNLDVSVILLCSSQIIRSLDVLTDHTIGLTKNKPVYHCSRCMATGSMKL